MELTGTGTLSLQKGKIVDSTENALDYGYRKLTFAHKMSSAGGEDHIPLDALQFPGGYESSIAQNPSANILLRLNLREFSANLTVYSTARGLLIPDISYWCSNSKIHLTGFTAQPNEIFYGIIEHVTRPNQLFVDAVPVNISRPLPFGQTTFNIGENYQVNAFENESSGAVKVYVDGTLVFRNTNNSDTTQDRDYYEVPLVDGLGTTIEFNSAFGSEVEVTVVSNYAYVDRPNFSLLNRLDTLATQLESLATQTGSTLDLSQFPNTFDIKAFGDRMLNAEDAKRLFDPALMSDAEATKLGYKKYVMNVSGANGWSPAQADGVPYQLQDGSWRLRANITGEFTTGGINTTSLAITGVVFSTSTQAASVHNIDGATVTVSGFCDNNTNTLTIVSSALRSIFTISFDVALASKPTWAI